MLSLNENTLIESSMFIHEESEKKFKRITDVHLIVWTPANKMIE